MKFLPFFQKEELSSSTRCAFLQYSIIKQNTNYFLFPWQKNDKLSQAGLYNSIKFLRNFSRVSEFFLYKPT